MTLLGVFFDSPSEATLFFSIVFVLAVAAHSFLGLAIRVISQRLAFWQRVLILFAPSQGFLLRAAVRGLLVETLIAASALYTVLVLVPAVCMLVCSTCAATVRLFRRRRAEPNNNNNSRRNNDDSGGTWRFHFVAVFLCIAVGSLIADCATKFVQPKLVQIGHSDLASPMLQSSSDNDASLYEVVSHHAGQVILFKRGSCDAAASTSLALYLLHDGVEVRCDGTEAVNGVFGNNFRLGSSSRLEMFGDGLSIQNCRFRLEKDSHVSFWNPASTQFVNTTFVVHLEKQLEGESENDNRRKSIQANVCRHFSSSATMPVTFSGSGSGTFFVEGAETVEHQFSLSELCDFNDNTTSFHGEDKNLKLRKDDDDEEEEETDQRFSALLPDTLKDKMSLPQRIVLLHVPQVVRLLRLCAPALAAAREGIEASLLWLQPRVGGILYAARAVSVGTLCGATKPPTAPAAFHDLLSLFLGSTCTDMENNTNSSSSDRLGPWAFRASSATADFIATSCFGVFMTCLGRCLEVELTLALPLMRFSWLVICTVTIEPAVAAASALVNYLKNADNLRNLLLGLLHLTYQGLGAVYAGVTVGATATWSASTGLLGLTWDASWSVMGLYCDTTVAVHLTIAALQTVIITAVLLRSVRRLRVEEEQRAAAAGRRFFLSALARRVMPQRWVSFNAAVFEIARTHSSAVALYATYHIVAICLVLGASVVRFLPGLLALCLHIALPLSSTYAFCCFFTDNPLANSPRVAIGDDGVADERGEPAAAPTRGRRGRRFMTPRWAFIVVSLGKVGVTIFVQKTVGDLLAYAASEMLKLVVICGAAVFAAKLLLGNRSSQPSADVAANPAPSQ
jgi:hypothetical protein